MPMSTVSVKSRLKVADEVWIITALLHREQPEQSDFAVEEIVERAKREGISRPLRSGLYVHVIQHCVANRPPNPGRYRILFETAPGRRRLFRKGDSYHPQREGAKITPSRHDLPHQYSSLLAWYAEWCSEGLSEAANSDPLLLLRGTGRQLWAREHSDDYVRRLREGWE